MRTCMLTPCGGCNSHWSSVARMVPPIEAQFQDCVFYPSRPSQRVQQTNSSMCQCLKFWKSLSKVICWSHRNISHSKSANRSSLSRWLSKAKVLLCCVFAVLVRASQFRIFLSDDFPGIVRLLFFWDVCAHQTQSNRRPCSPHVLSLQLDRCNNERYVELDVCQEFGGPFTPFSDRQLWGPWNLSPLSAEPVVGIVKDFVEDAARLVRASWAQRTVEPDSLPVAVRCRQPSLTRKVYPTSILTHFWWVTKKERTPQLYAQTQRYMSNELGGLHLKTCAELLQTDFLDACPTFWYEVTFAWEIDTYKFYSWILFWRYDFNDSAFDVVSEKVVIDIRMLEWIVVVTLGVTLGRALPERHTHRRPSGAGVHWLWSLTAPERCANTIPTWSLCIRQTTVHISVPMEFQHVEASFWLNQAKVTCTSCVHRVKLFYVALPTMRTCMLTPCGGCNSH